MNTRDVLRSSASSDAYHPTEYFQVQGNKRAEIKIGDKTANVRVLHEKDSLFYKFFFCEKVFIDGEFLDINKRSFSKHFGSEVFKNRRVSAFWKTTYSQVVEKAKNLWEGMKRLNPRLSIPDFRKDASLILKQLKKDPLTNTKVIKGTFIEATFNKYELEMVTAIATEAFRRL